MSVRQPAWGWAVVTAAAPDHVTAVREYLVDALQPSDLTALRRIGEDVAQRIDPERSFRHGRAT